MLEPRVCPKCSKPLPVNAPAGICPKCLLNAGFPTETVTAGFIPPDPSELAAHFPDLEIGELLGKGGMGAVYKAQQQRLDRVVAVKILPPEVSRDPTFAERFTREARTLARLNHPNIVQVYDFGQAGQYFYFVMEFVDGLNLRQVIEAGNLQSQEALAIVPSVCAALQFAHDAGVVHRDIKPENILLDQHGRVKIADFGLAMLLDREPAEVTLTGANQVMGTPHYMAPEQMRGSHTIDHRADIYSLGVVFYELLTGELPIGRFDPPSKKVRIDVRLDEVVLRSLESTPDRRYQHASDVKTEIESIVGFNDTQLPPFRPAEPHTADFESLVRSQLKVPAIGLLVAGIVNLLATLMVLLLPVLAHLTIGFDEGSGFVEGKSTFAEATFLSIVIAICSLVSGIILVLGAARMFDLQSYGIALIAAVVAILPCAIGFPISLPFGIWALIVVLRHDVRNSFADENAVAQQEQKKESPDSAVGGMMAIGLSLGVALGAALNNIAVFMCLGMILGILVGTGIDANNRRNSKD